MYIVTNFCITTPNFTSHHIIMYIVAKFCITTPNFTSHHIIMYVVTNFCITTPNFTSHHIIMYIVAQFCITTPNFTKHHITRDLLQHTALLSTIFHITTHNSTRHHIIRLLVTKYHIIRYRITTHYQTLTVTALLRPVRPGGQRPGGRRHPWRPRAAQLGINHSLLDPVTQLDARGVIAQAQGSGPQGRGQCKVTSSVRHAVVVMEPCWRSYPGDSLYPRDSSTKTVYMKWC